MNTEAGQLKRRGCELALRPASCGSFRTRKLFAEGAYRELFSVFWGMPRAKSVSQPAKVRGQSGEANSLGDVATQTAKLWRKHHLTYDQSKHVVEQARRELGLDAPRERRRTVERLDRGDIECLIETAYGLSSRYGFMVKMLFYTGTRVSEFVHIRVEHLHLVLDPPQVYIAHAKGGSDGYVPLLPTLAQELRTHLNGRRLAMSSKVTGRTSTPRDTFSGWSRPLHSGQVSTRT